MFTVLCCQMIAYAYYAYYGYYGYSMGSYSESIVGSKFHEVLIFMVSVIAYS